MGGIKILALVLGCFIAYFGYWHYQYQHAESAANQFCASVALGSDVSEAVARTQDMKSFRHGFQDDKSRYVVTFQGPIFNAFVCELTLADGKVTARRVTAMDD